MTAEPLTIAFSAGMGIVTYSIGRFAARTELSKSNNGAPHLAKGIAYGIGAATFPTILAAAALGGDTNSFLIAAIPSLIGGLAGTLGNLPRLDHFYADADASACRRSTTLVQAQSLKDVDSYSSKPTPSDSTRVESCPANQEWTPEVLRDTPVLTIVDQALLALGRADTSSADELFSRARSMRKVNGLEFLEKGLEDADLGREVFAIENFKRAAALFQYYFRCKERDEVEFRDFCDAGRPSIQMVQAAFSLAEAIGKLDGLRGLTEGKPTVFEEVFRRPPLSVQLLRSLRNDCEPQPCEDFDAKYWVESYCEQRRCEAVNWLDSLEARGVPLGLVGLYSLPKEFRIEVSRRSFAAFPRKKEAAPERIGGANEANPDLSNLATLIKSADSAEEVSAEDEELVEKCYEVMRQEKKASTSLFQRRLRLGYTRAARILDIMEMRGYVGPGEGAKPREILVDLESEEM